MTQADHSLRLDVLQVLSAISDIAEIDLLDQYLSDFNGRTATFSQDRRLPKEIAGKSLVIFSGARILSGGGGIVVQCADAAVPSVQYALKVTRPSLLQGKPSEQIESEVRKAEAETTRHLQLGHPNIARLYGAKKVEMTLDAARQLQLPCWIIEWVDGALPFDTYCVRNRCQPTEILELFLQATSALAHAHQAHIVHWDIKSENILVSSSGQVKLMDFGNARSVRVEPYEVDEVAVSTRSALPPELTRRTQLPDGTNGGRHSPEMDSNRYPVELYRTEKSWDLPSLDLYMLAAQIVRVCEPFRAVQLDQTSRDLDENERYCLRYIEAITSRMMREELIRDDPFFSSAEMVVEALDRLLPTLGAADGMAELSTEPQHVMRIPPSTNVAWTERMSALLNCGPMLRLKGHRQLGSTHHVYPGASHSRWEHSAGTVAQVSAYVRALMEDRDSIEFRLATTRLDIEALLLVAALHDLGHPAFGHQLEETLVVRDELSHEAHCLAVLETCLGHTAKSELVRADAQEIATVIREHWCGSSDYTTLIKRCLEILRADESFPLTNDRQEDAAAHLSVLKSIISGPFDADKTDYLIRDGWHSGVTYASAIDRLRLMQSLTTFRTKNEERGSAGIAVSSKGLAPVDSILFSRYLMFGYVYWQRTVRAMTAMLEEALEVCLLGGDLSPVISGDIVQLVEVFRVQSDEDSLRWLRSTFASRSADEALTGLIEGAEGRRDAIYWCASELYGGSHPPRNEMEVRDVDLYGELSAEQETLVKLARTDPAAAVERRRTTRHALAERLAETVGSPLTWRDLLLDIPVSSKDQVKGLFVSGSFAARGGVVPVEDVTPISTAVHSAFLRSVRLARVYVRPEAARCLWQHHSEESLAPIVAACLREVLTGQRRLPD